MGEVGREQSPCMDPGGSPVGKGEGATGCGAVRRGMWIRGGSEGEGSRSQTLQGLEGHSWGGLGSFRRHRGAIEGSKAEG